MKPSEPCDLCFRPKATTFAELTGSANHCARDVPRASPYAERDCHVFAHSFQKARADAAEARAHHPETHEKCDPISCWTATLAVTAQAMSARADRLEAALRRVVEVFGEEFSYSTSIEQARAALGATREEKNG